MSSDASFKSTILSFLLRHRNLLLAGGLFCIAPAIWYSQNLELDQSIESLYALDDPHLQDFQESRRIFGGDEFVIIAFSDPELIQEYFPDDLIENETDQPEEQLPERDEEEDLEEEGYRDLSIVSQKKIEWFSQRLKNIPGIQIDSIQDLAKSSQPRTITFELRGKDRSMEVAIPPEQLFELLSDWLISQDQQTTAIVVRLLPENQTSTERRITIRQIRKLAEEFQQKYQHATYVAGEPVQVHDMFLYVEQDGETLFIVSLGLLACVLLILFRSVRWVLLAVLVVVMAISITEALLVFSDVRLSMVSSMLNSLVTIIGIATVTHVTVRYREHRQQAERIDSLQMTFFELLPAIFWSCATTGIGFLALTSSDITPVKSLGLMMALAAGLVFVAALVLLPGGALAGKKHKPPGFAPSEQSLSKLLTWLARCIQHRPKQIAICGCLCMLIAAYGLTRLHVETDFSKNFREESPIIQSLNFVENRLGGAGSWEVNFPAPQKLTNSYLKKVRILADRLRTEVNQPDNVRLTKILCMPDGIDPIPRLPLITNNLTKKLNVLNQMQPEFGTALYNPQAGRMRIMLRSIERQPARDKLELIEQVQSIANSWAVTHLQAEFPNHKVKTTGLFVLLAYLIDNLLADQLISFLLAGLGIVVMMSIAFRSFSIGFISLVPNLFPILLVIGGMGWIGLPINIATAMIASVSLGLTVDSSIHYLTEFQRARKSLSVTEAIAGTHQRVGRALIFANLALIAGFSVLALSHFIPLIYFGILVSLAMLGGLLGNLLLLPVLLKLSQER